MYNITKNNYQILDKEEEDLLSKIKKNNEKLEKIKIEFNKNLNLNQSENVKTEDLEKKLSNLLNNSPNIPKTEDFDAVNQLISSTISTRKEQLNQLSILQMYSNAITEIEKKKINSSQEILRDIERNLSELDEKQKDFYQDLAVANEKEFKLTSYPNYMTSVNETLLFKLDNMIKSIENNLPYYLADDTSFFEAVRHLAGQENPVQSTERKPKPKRYRGRR